MNGPTTRPCDNQQNKKEDMPNSELRHFGWPQGKTEGKRKEIGTNTLQENRKKFGA